MATIPDQNITVNVDTQITGDPIAQRLIAVAKAGDALRSNERGGPITIPRSEPGSVLDIIDLADYVVTGRRPGETVELVSDYVPDGQPVEIVEGHLDETAIRADQTKIILAKVRILIDTYGTFKMLREFDAVTDWSPDDE